MSEFIDVEWYDAGTSGFAGQNVGIVLIYDQHVGFKCYLGIGEGVSPEHDMMVIRRMGTKIDHKLANAIWGSRMRAEWISRNLANDARLSYAYKYDGKRYAGDKYDALKKIAAMSQGDLKRIMQTYKLADELDPLFHAIKQIKKKQT